MAVEFIVNTLSKLKEFVIKKGFKNIQEEIHFFKHQKPLIVAKLIYYNAIYKIETKKPHGRKLIRKYLNKELKKLKRFFDNNLEFYRYYRTNNSIIDDKLFVREKHNLKLSLDTIYFETDLRFSTSHNKKGITKNGSYLLNWTGSKTALTELIYALYLQGVFDNGSIDIKNIAKTFERAFNVHLGDFYHTFMELKARKVNRTKFLDSLRDALIRKIDEQEELH